MAKGLLSAGAALICSIFPEFQKAIMANGGSDEDMEVFAGKDSNFVISKMARAGMEAIRVLKQVEGWNRFYKEVIGMDADFSSATVPAKYNPTNHWLIGLARGLEYGRLQEAICLWEQERGRPAPYFYQNLATIQKEYEQRLPEKSYFVVSGNHVNAIDGNIHLTGKSNQNIHEEKLPVQNAMERLVLDLFVDWMACQDGGVQLLDQKGWTRTCSRWGGSTVYVDRGGFGQLYVLWGYLGFAGPGGRARAVDSVS